jgi:hypothetical protein
MRRESLPAIERQLRRYTNPSLLIIDELGYVPCDSDAADLLFRIVSKRHENRSIVITTNLAYKQWGTVFGDAPCLVALIDRFAQHAMSSTSTRTLGATRSVSKRTGASHADNRPPGAVARSRPISPIPRGRLQIPPDALPNGPVGSRAGSPA